MSGDRLRASPGTGQPCMSRSYPYHLYEMAHAALAPARAVSDATHFVFRNPWNPLSNTALGKNISAGAELFERMTRRYGKPTFGLDEIEVDGVVYPVLEDVVWSRPFCNLLRFVRPDLPGRANQPKLMIVAPMSGHYATLAPRHGRGVSAPFRRLHHRLGGRAHGSAGGRLLRPRRLHRLSARDAGSISAPASTRSASASRRCRCLPRPR